MTDRDWGDPGNYQWDDERGWYDANDGDNVERLVDVADVSPLQISDDTSGWVVPTWAVIVTGLLVLGLGFGIGAITMFVYVIGG